jgi:hypothetical protein
VSAIDELRAKMAAAKAAKAKASGAPANVQQVPTQQQAPVTPSASSPLPSVLDAKVQPATDADEPPVPEVPAKLASPAELPTLGSNIRHGEHPLIMEMEELEAALLGKLPEFRTILRDIHAKLRQDPDVVTAMTEEEIGLLVSGLIYHANVEIIAPKEKKAAKKISKLPVNADDL